MQTLALFGGVGGMKCQQALRFKQVARYVKRSAMSVFVFNKEKEKRTKKEKEITPSKKVAVCRLPRVFKRKKEKYQKKDRKYFSYTTI